MTLEDQEKSDINADREESKWKVITEWIKTETCI